MVNTYQALEGELSVRSAATTTRTGATDSVAIVGGYDTANAASGVTHNEATKVTDPANADETFGTSELARAARVASAAGAGEIYGVPVEEFQNTESFSSTNTGTLTDTPLFDPQFHPDHEITVTDTDTSTDLNVLIEYTDGGTLHVDDTIVTDDTDNVNNTLDTDDAAIDPVTGEIDFGASGNYDVTYTYGDYDTAIQTAVDLDVRYVIVLTEGSSAKVTLQNELANRAANFDFKRGVVGAQPEISVGNIGSYTPDVNDWRVIEVAPPYASSVDGSVRTAAAVGGFMADQPIGPDGSTLYDQLEGLESFNTNYQPTDAKNFSNVTALARDGRVAKAATTSTESQFQNVYATEIIDDVALNLFGEAREYAGGPQDVGDLQARLETVCQSHSSGNPPDLGFATNTNAPPYDVSVSLDENDDSIANTSISIVPYPIAETVNVSLTVADGYVEFAGAN